MVLLQQAIPYLPSLVAFYGMQENTALQFCHFETSEEPPLAAFYDMQENTAAQFYAPSTAGE